MNSAKGMASGIEADVGDAPFYAGIAEPSNVFRNRPIWFAYPAALALTATAVGVRLSLDAVGEGVVAFTLFYLAVLASTFFGGAGPGLLSLAASAFAVTVFWLEPKGALSLSRTGFVNLVLFIVTSGIMILVAHFLRTSLFNLRQSEARLNLSQEVGQIGVWDWDLQSGELWWSPAFYEMTGMNPDEPPSLDAFLQRIDIADRGRVSGAFDAAMQGKERLDIQFRFNREDGVTVWLAGRAELFRNTAGSPSRLLGINIDVTFVRTADSERNKANTLLRTFFDSLPGAAYVKDAEGRILLGNPGFAAAIGKPSENFLGKTDIEFLNDEKHARTIVEHDRELLREGISRQFEEDIVLPDGQLSHWLSVKTPFTDADGRIEGLIGISLDITERLKAETRVRFLADEVDHRAKNLMGVVQAMVRLTKAADILSFKTALGGRIQALARAHNQLAASRWEGVDLVTLVNDELAPFTRIMADQIHVSGPSVKLEPGVSQAMTMVLHELATNAARFGALSVESGELTVAWKLTESGTQTLLELLWTETGGPAVASTVEPGFGSVTIRGSIEHQLGGQVAIDWAPTGIVCRIVIAVAQRVVQDPPAADPADGGGSGGTTGDRDGELAGKRVLVIDDEALIAITLKDAVEELGCDVVGPAGSADAALGLIRERAPDLAILDVNLAGSSSAPVAAALRALSIPFIYCTGYAETAKQIEGGLQSEMLTKPVDPHELEAALKRAVAA